MAFHDFDPYDMMISLHENQGKIHQHIATMVEAHNTSQTQINDLIKQNSKLRLEITALKAALREIKLNIKSKDDDNG